MKRQIIQRSKAGDPVSAKHFNEFADRLNDSTAINSATNDFQYSPYPIMVEVVEVEDDTIKCRMPAKQAGAENDFVYVAKQYLLRRTPFDGKEADANGSTFKYLSGFKRTETIGEDSEDQEIMPPYNEGDLILISPYVGFKDGMSQIYIDITGGRVWAAVCTAIEEE